MIGLGLSGQSSAAGVVAVGGVLNFAPVTPALGQLDLVTNVGATNTGQPTSHVRGVVLGFFTGGI